MDFHAAQVPAPKYWDEFEDLCHCLFKAVWNDPTAKKHGRRGQPQHGVDIFGSPNEQGTLYRGVQCKGKDQNYGSVLTSTELELEVEKAKEFTPGLRQWILVTTAPNDARIQAKARELSRINRAKGLFAVEVLGWNDLTGLIAEHRAVLEQFYPDRAFDARSVLQRLDQLLPSRVVLRQDLIDQEIRDHLRIVLHSRFFLGVDPLRLAREFTSELSEGSLSGGSEAPRARALAWCARLLAVDKDLAPARQTLRLAQSLQHTDEAMVAEAFITSAKGDVSSALRLLAPLASAPARSAAYRIVRLRSGLREALAWERSTKLTFEDFDAEGKFLAIDNRLAHDLLDEALENVQRLEGPDYDACPVLLLLAAITYVSSSLPKQLRSALRHSSPAEMAMFPLSSDKQHIETRRLAVELLDQCAAATRHLGLLDVVGFCEDFALWLRLHDPSEQTSARKALTESLSDSRIALRRIPMAFAHGVPFDRTAVEQEIERQVSLAGAVSLDAAHARMVLAISLASPRDSADYIDRYRKDVYGSLRPSFMALVEIDALTKAGLIERAESLQQLVQTEDATAYERHTAERLIAESRGADAIITRKSRYEETGSVQDLFHLVQALRERRDWQGLCEYGLAPAATQLPPSVVT